MLQNNSLHVFLLMSSFI